MSDWDTGDEFNPYKPGTGLKDNYDGVIVDGTFTADPQTGRTSIIIMVHADDGDEVPVRYGVGPNWESYDGGASVQHPGGDKQLFSNNVAFSDFMSHAWESGAKDHMMQRVREGKGPRFGDNWNGMRFHFDVLQRPSRIRNEETGEWENSTIARTLPTKFLGFEGEQGTLNVQAGTAVSAPSAPTQDPLSGLDAVTAGKVRHAAKTATSYTSFIDEMLELTDADNVPIMERSEIGAAVSDESWWQSLHDQ